VNNVRSSRKRRLGLLFTSIAVALIIVDSTIVNVAIPSVVEDLNLNSTQVQWVQESYTLVFAAVLLVFGTPAATAATGELLIASRLVQGIDGAMTLPASLSPINATSVVVNEPSLLPFGARRTVGWRPSICCSAAG
jgi:MFS family permease